MFYLQRFRALEFLVIILLPCSFSLELYWNDFLFMWKLCRFCKRGKKSNNWSYFWLQNKHHSRKIFPFTNRVFSLSSATSDSQLFVNHEKLSFRNLFNSFIIQFLSFRNQQLHDFAINTSQFQLRAHRNRILEMFSSRTHKKREFLNRFLTLTHITSQHSASPFFSLFSGVSNSWKSF